VTNVIGLECSGYLINDLKELDNEEYKKGKRVMALLPGGGYAE
jgi:hypothetical protein